MSIAKTIILFALAAVAEIGGAWLIWQAVREDKSWWWAALGVMALGAYGFIAAQQADAARCTADQNGVLRAKRQ